MYLAGLLVACSWPAPLDDPRVKMIQVHPPRRSVRTMCRSPKQPRAVVLIHGLDLRDEGEPASVPRFQSWQGSTSGLVRRLAQESDVYSLSYAQHEAIEDIAWYRGLRQSVARVKSLGYNRVILVGHSAGGVVARHFVEDFPKSGVGMVIQVSAPNAGAGLAGWAVTASQIPRSQSAFISSLTLHHRRTLCESRSHRLIPKNVDFVNVLVTTSPHSSSDTVVNKCCQWSRCLQLQRVPCVQIYAKHTRVMHDTNAANTIATLAKTRQHRWSRGQVFRARRKLGLIPD